MMRYRDTGAVHMDFHRTLNGTIAYLREKYGQAFVGSVFRRTAREVYRAIHDDLKRGDPGHLIAHWRYYMEREGGEFRIEESDGEIRMVVSACPAVTYLHKRGTPVDAAFCEGTCAFNEGLAEGTPFEITTEVTGDGQCVQIVRRRCP